MATDLTIQDLDLLHQKIDRLTEQVELQQKRQQDLQELKDDLIPIANHMIKLTIDELAEIGTEFQLEDLLFLLKRLLRNTHTLVDLMERLEAGMDLVDEVNILGKQVFSNMVENLDELEHKGYFAFAREGMQILERIVQEFDEADVKALGENIVTILTTVRNMTQPEILNLANSALSAINPREEVEEISTIRLIRELGNPRVRRGMARLLNMVKALDDQSMEGNGAKS